MSTPRKKATKKKALVVQGPYNTDARVVAVTGAYSFIGAQIIAQLEQDKRYAKILALDIRKPTQPLAKTTFHKIDLTLPAADSDLAALFSRERVDTADSRGRSCRRPRTTRRGRTSSSRSARCTCSTPRPKRSCVSSSCGRKRSCTARTRSIPTSCRRSTSLRGTPASRFVMDKVEAEKQVKRFAKENPDIVVTTLRAAATLGPDDSQFRHALFLAAGCAHAHGLRSAHAVRARGGCDRPRSSS